MPSQTATGLTLTSGLCQSCSPPGCCCPQRHGGLRGSPTPAPRPLPAPLSSPRPRCSACCLRLRRSDFSHLLETSGTHLTFNSPGHEHLAGWARLLFVVCVCVCGRGMSLSDCLLCHSHIPKLGRVTLCLNILKQGFKTTKAAFLPFWASLMKTAAITEAPWARRVAIPAFPVCIRVTAASPYLPLATVPLHLWCVSKLFSGELSTMQRWQ